MGFCFCTSRRFCDQGEASSRRFCDQKEASPLQSSSGQQEDSPQCHGQGRYPCQGRRWGRARAAPPATPDRCGAMSGWTDRDFQSSPRGLSWQGQGEAACASPSSSWISHGCSSSPASTPGKRREPGRSTDNDRLKSCRQPSANSREDVLPP